MDSTQKQVESLGEEPQQTDPLREVQVRELQAQLETLRSKMHQMEALERSFSQTQRQLEVSDCHTMVLNRPNNSLDDPASPHLTWSQFSGTENAARREADEEKAPGCLTRGVPRTQTARTRNVAAAVTRVRICDVYFFSVSKKR